MKSFVLLPIILLTILLLSCNGTVTKPDIICTPLAQRTAVTLSAFSKDSAWLQLPCDYNDSTSLRNYPLLIFLNGKGEASNQGNLDVMLKLALPKLMRDSVRFEFQAPGGTYNCIVICPQSQTGFRTANSTNAVIDYMVNNYRIDQSRIYLTGLSAGAQSVYDYLTESQQYANRIAAAVPMSSLILDATHKAHLSYISNANVHIESFCGTNDDPLYTYNQQYVNAINTAKPGLALFTGYKGEHCCWNKIYDPSHEKYNPNMYEWLLQFHK